MTRSPIASLTEPLDLHRREVASGERFEFGRNWAAFLLGARRGANPRRRTRPAEPLGGESGSWAQLSRHRIGQRTVEPGRTAAWGPRAFVRLRPALGGLYEGAPAAILPIRHELDSRARFGAGHGPRARARHVRHRLFLGRAPPHRAHVWTHSRTQRSPVAPGGKLFVAIYNDTGTQARRWRWIKRTFNRAARLRPHSLRRLRYRTG